MKVAELIEKLKACNPNAVVLRNDAEEGYVEFEECKESICVSDRYGWQDAEWYEGHRKGMHKEWPQLEHVKAVIL